MICYGSILNGPNSRSNELMQPMNETSHPPLDTASADSSRWIALVVLCAGFLMIILDQTIVNVALPSIQTRPALLAVEPGVGRQRVPDRVRRPAAARRTARRPDRPPADLPRRADGVHAGLAALRPRRQPGAADRRPVRAGHRRRDDLGGDPRDDRDDVPRAVASRPRRSASTASSPRPAARSACSPAASSPRRSTGTGSSSSTCRSGSSPACSPRGCCPTTAASA